MAATIVKMFDTLRRVKWEQCQVARLLECGINNETLELCHGTYRCVEQLMRFGKVAVARNQILRICTDGARQELRVFLVRREVDCHRHEPT